MDKEVLQNMIMCAFDCGQADLEYLMAFNTDIIFSILTNRARSGMGVSFNDILYDYFERMVNEICDNVLNCYDQIDIVTNYLVSDVSCSEETYNKLMETNAAAMQRIEKKYKFIVTIND